MTEHLGDITTSEPSNDREALHEHFDAANASRLRLISVLVGAGALAELIFALVESRWLHAVVPVGTLALARHFFIARDRGLYQRMGSTMLLLGAIVLLSSPIAMRQGSDLVVRIVAIVGPLVLSTFRLTRLESAVVFPLVWLAGIAQPIAVALRDGEPMMSPRVLIQTGTVALCWYVNQVSSRRDASEYLQRYRIAASRNRERLRMRRELDSARQMQLSMLPRESPRVDGLDIAAVSLPAAEVGGDYYEYFAARGAGMELAIGDVSGHGVASALLLSGLRSCLYLLQPERIEPAQILQRLDGMVRDTTERRTFITLLYSVLDLDRRRVTVSAAGHPPPLHYLMVENRVTEISCASPPLGTRLGSEYCTVESDFAPGDVLVFYTDGLTETTNYRDQAYGDDRLSARLSRTSHMEARQIRESILADLWTFKGDAEQHDDITLVVVKALADAVDEPLEEEE